MFWLGIGIALIAGILSIGLARERIRKRFPRLAELHLDLVALGLLIVGLVLSSIHHLGDMAKYSAVRELYAKLEVEFSGNWAEQPYPKQILSPVDDQFYVYFKRGSGPDATVVKLFASQPYNFATLDSSRANFTSRQALRPSDYPVGENRRVLWAFDTIGFHIPFLDLKDFSEPSIIVQVLRLDLVLNGVHGEPIRIESPIVAPVRTYGNSVFPWGSFEIQVDLSEHLPE